MSVGILKGAILVIACAAYSSVAIPEDSDADKIAQYREMISDANPAQFDEMRGEDLWNKPGGPNNVSMEGL